ncbi:MAG TPA: hypothetical protein PLQ13_02880 [Candidatus Krumholzibacteria bacterium]|nr:hypothetical protein [Candidatus Krumholzibacteria bacterium]
MFLFNLIRLLAVLLVGRWLWRRFVAPRPGQRTGVHTGSQGGPGRTGPLSERDITDADFEEIP